MYFTKKIIEHCKNKARKDVHHFHLVTGKKKNFNMAKPHTAGKSSW